MNLIVEQKIDCKFFMAFSLYESVLNHRLFEPHGVYGVAGRKAGGGMSGLERVGEEPIERTTCVTARRCKRSSAGCLGEACVLRERARGSGC